MRLIAVGDDVWVGDYVACDERGLTFPLAIHGWKAANIAEGRICACLRGSGGWGLPVRLEEGRQVGSWDRTLDAIGNYARRPGKLLAHCAGGAYRGPTLALVAKIARGRPPLEAVLDIYQAMWFDSRCLPGFMTEPTEEIFRWAETLPS